MTWNEYKNQNQLKGRYSKNRIAEHDRALYAAWFNLYERPQTNLINQVNNILKQK